MIYLIVQPAPMAHSYHLGLVTWRYQVRIPVGPDIYHLGCSYTVLQTVQRHGVYSAVYGSVHYKEPLKSFKIRVGHSTGFILSRYCLNVQNATSSNIYIHTYIYLIVHSFMHSFIHSSTSSQLYYAQNYACLNDMSSIGTCEKHFMLMICYCRLGQRML